MCEFLRKLWHWFWYKDLVGPFAAFDITAVLWLIGCAIVALMLCPGCLPQRHIVREPGTLVYKVDGHAHYPLCRETIPVVSQEIDGMEAAWKVARACQYWNEARGAEVFEFAGMAAVDLGSRTRPFMGEYIVVAAMSRQDAEYARKKFRRSTPTAVTTGFARQNTLNASLDFYSLPGGGFREWDRDGARIKQGRCCFGGVVVYEASDPLYRYIAETEIIHELGHMLGLWHSDDHFSVMRYHIDERTHYYQTLGGDSLARLRELYPPEP